MWQEYQTWIREKRESFGCGLPLGSQGTEDGGHIQEPWVTTGKPLRAKEKGLGDDLLGSRLIQALGELSREMLLFTLLLLLKFLHSQPLPQSLGLATECLAADPQLTPGASCTSCPLSLGTLCMASKDMTFPEVPLREELLEGNRELHMLCLPASM